MFKSSFLFVVLLAGIAFSGQFTDSTMKTAFIELKSNQYEKAIQILLKGTIIEDSILNNKQIKGEWISQISTFQKAYGDYQDYEKVYEFKLGKITKVYYLIYCKKYPISFIATLYTFGGKENLLDIEFSNKIINLPEKMQSYKSGIPLQKN